MLSFLKTTVARVIVALAVLGIATVAPHAAFASGCDASNAVRDSSASSPTALSITGTDVQRSSMDALWSLVSGTDDTKFRVLGTAIGAANNWMGNCTYPGIGLGVGSGYDYSTRNVTIWLWEDGVNLDFAREAVYALIGEQVGSASITGPTQVLTNDQATFSAANSMPSFSSLTYSWDLDDDGVFETNTGSTSRVTTSWGQAGSHAVRVKVTRSSGVFNTASTNVSVMLAPTGSEPGVSILDGSPRTTSLNVTVNMVWPAFATAARISNDGAFSSLRTSTVALAESLAWTLEDAGDGVYSTSVYVRFVGPGIDATRTYVDSIVLDRSTVTTTSTTSTTIAPLATSTSDVVVSATRFAGAPTGVASMSVRSIAQLVSRSGRGVAMSVLNSRADICRVDGENVVAVRRGVCRVKVSLRAANGKTVSRVITFAMRPTK